MQHPLLSQSAVAVVARGRPVSPHPAQRTQITYQWDNRSLWLVNTGSRDTNSVLSLALVTISDHDDILHGPDILHPGHHPRVFLCRWIQFLVFVKPDKLGSVPGLKHTSKDGGILMSTQNVAPFASSYDSAWVCCDTLLLGFAPYQTLALSRVPDSDSRMRRSIGLTTILCDSQESEYSVKSVALS